MSPTLPVAREAFLAEVNRDTSGPERARFALVLDALIEWSLKRPKVLAFQADDGPSIGVSFERVGTKVVFWSARVARGKGPKLEIYPPSGRSLTPEERARVMQTLNAHSREVLLDGDRLRIGFTALKNVAGRTAVLALLDELLGGARAQAESVASQA
ncbi:MAG: hypothetical protein WKG32_00585 [Gemmatimonadaceae bacterium]